MRPPEFTPPYDSPIEEIFAYDAIKRLSRGIDFEVQVVTPTPWGNFRLDFLLTTPDGKKIAVECDGHDFHDEWRDEWRDAAILGHTEIDVIYRFRGSDLFHRSNECLYLMSLLNPELFSERGLINLENLVSNHLKEVELDPLRDRHVVTGKDRDTYSITRRLRSLPHPRDQYWPELYTFAQSYGPGSLDEVKEAFTASLWDPKRVLAPISEDRAKQSGPQSNLPLGDDPQGTPPSSR